MNKYLQWDTEEYLNIVRSYIQSKELRHLCEDATNLVVLSLIKELNTYGFVTLADVARTLVDERPIEIPCALRFYGFSGPVSAWLTIRMNNGESTFDLDLDKLTLLI